MARVISVFLPNWPTDRLRRKAGDAAPPGEAPLVIAGREKNRRVVTAADPAAQALWAAALRIYEPRVSVELSPPGARYPKQPAPAVYLCDETTCSRPVREPAAIAEAVAAFVGRGAAQ